MILVTGGSGFIGSNVIRALNERGQDDIIICDVVTREDQWKNLIGLRFQDYWYALKIPDFYSKAGRFDKLTTIVHLGAATDTQDLDWEGHAGRNLTFSHWIWTLAIELNIPLIYASSAATYGDGSKGFSDDHAKLKNLVPQNPYAITKHAFDLFTIQAEETPPQWYGLKFFNAYGPGESHKGKQASVIYQWIKELTSHPYSAWNGLRLFKSTNPDINDGDQKRDFIYVDDIVDVIIRLLFSKGNSALSGIYNVGTGMARTFNEVAELIFRELDMSWKVRYEAMPEAMASRFQNFTQADMDKLRRYGICVESDSLGQGISDYVKWFERMRELGKEGNEIKMVAEV